MLMVCIILTGPTLGSELDPRLADQFERHCSECHQGENAEADLDLSSLSRQLDSSETFTQWQHIHDRVRDGEMPPDVDALSETDRLKLVESLGATLHQTDLADVRSNGRGALRRLTREEYEASLRDLLKLPHLDIRNHLPEDRLAEDTNRVASVLDVTRVQLRAYLNAASAALSQAVASGVEPRRPVHYRALATKMFPKAVDHAGRESSRLRTSWLPRRRPWRCGRKQARP